MTPRRTIALAAAAGIVSALAVTVAVRAAGDKVAFPEKFGVLYATIDRQDNKQYRELYASSQAAIDAAKAGKPLPSGTVLTLVQYAAQLDAKGNPVKDANGRFIKTDKILGYTVMEKRTGWGVEYPDDIRNGEWEYQAFTPARKPNPKANLANCFKCHKPLAKQDFVYSYDRMKSAMK